MFVVAGVTGHVGSVVADQLLTKGQKVRVIVRDAGKGATWKDRGAELAVGSLDDAAFLAGAFQGADGAFVLVPPNYGWTDVFAGQRALADAYAAAVKKSGLKHVVLLSSIGADLEAGTGPIKGVHYAENVLRASGAVITAIRAGYFQENVGNAVGAAKGMGIFPCFLPSADYPFPMIATKDIGAVAADSLLAKPAKSEVIDLHGPSYTFRQVGEKLGAALGKELKLVMIPQDQWVSTLAQAGLPKPFAEAFAEMYDAFAKGIAVPRGDRMVQGKTTLDEVIRALAS